MKSRFTSQKMLVDIIIVVVALTLCMLATPSGIIPTAHAKPSVFLGFYIIYLGVLFLLSYFYSGASYVLGFLMWVCEHFSRQPGRWMAFVYFGIAIVVGSCALLSAFGLLK